ncbi:MAG: gamma-glutamyltransferase [Pirellulales bacterium]|nr:gamma-glutamyltransferase [Pirellulales bacterium]
MTAPIRAYAIVSCIAAIAAVRPAIAETPGVLWKAAGDNGAVAAGGAEAADAALEMLKRGNAVDAAVTAVLVLSVTDPTLFCIGGEMPMLVYDARRGVVEVVAGLGVAPRLATVDYFAKHKGGRIPEADDPATAAVPGAFDACLAALDRYGTITFAEAARPTLRILETHRGGWQADLAKTLRRLMEAETSSGGDRRRGLRLVADCFYRGPIARELDAWSRAHGGLLRYADLATHVTRIEDPVCVDYRGLTICKCGVWTQGPYLLETLRLLEKFDLRALGHNSPGYIHALVEAMKLGLADRDTHYADPLFVEVPLRELLSVPYADLRRGLIDMDRASLELRPGDPRGGKALLRMRPESNRVPAGPAGDTTTCVVADRFGNVVAATPSGFGGVLAGETGIRLGSRLRSFNAWRGHPDCIEPGKRPRITLTPTLVLEAGKPVAAISVAGGDLQDQVGLQLLLSYMEFGLSPEQAVTAPRFATEHLIGSFNQPPPKLGSLSVYESLGRATIDALTARGHRVDIVKPPLGNPVMLILDPKTGRKNAAGDPRANRHARAY